MKKTLTISLIFISLLIVLGSCASKRYTKKGQKLEASGQYSEAADMFYQAVVVKRTNIEAMAGLNRCGQLTLSKKLSEFNHAYTNGQNKEAVYFYQEAKNYYDKLNNIGCQLNFPAFYEDYYNSAKDTYLEDKYFEASRLLDQEKFTESEAIFREIINLQPNYKDSKDKLIISVNEPRYRNGLSLMETNQYRSAYYIFETIIEAAGAYKSSYDLKKECLEKGSFSISIKPIINYSTTAGIESVLESKIVSTIQKANNPFIKLLYAQQTGGKTFESNTSVNQKLPQADAILYVEITKFDFDKGELKEFDKRGYLKKTIKVLNKETGEYDIKTEYDKVSYKEYKMLRTIDMSFTYKLVNAKTNEIYKTSSENIQCKDEVYYAKYSGDATNLVPGYWKDQKVSSPEDYITDKPEAIKELNNLLNARTQIKDFNTLSTESTDSTAAVVSKDVINFVNNN